MTHKWTTVAVALVVTALLCAALAVSAQHHADGRLQQRAEAADFDDAQADQPPAGKDESAQMRLSTLLRCAWSASCSCFDVAADS